MIATHAAPGERKIDELGKNTLIKVRFREALPIIGTLSVGDRTPPLGQIQPAKESVLGLNNDTVKG